MSFRPLGARALLTVLIVIIVSYSVECCGWCVWLNDASVFFQAGLKAVCLADELLDLMIGVEFSLACFDDAEVDSSCNSFNWGDLLASDQIDVERWVCEISCVVHCDYILGADLLPVQHYLQKNALFFQHCPPALIP